MRTGRPGIRWLAAPVLCIVLAGAAQAQEISGIYVGFGAGLLSYEEADLISDSGGIYRIVGGYQLNSNYAIEAGWAQSDDIKEQVFVAISANQIGRVDVNVESEVKTLRVLALAPFSGLNMFGSVGYFDADFTANFSLHDPMNPQSGPLQQQSIEESDSGVTVAGGIQYDFTRVSVRGEYEWFDTDDVDATAINLIAVFRF